MTSPSPNGLSGVDWARVRERVEGLGHAIAGDERLSPGETAAILEARALSLATPPPSRANGGALEVVVFELAPEVYALESRFVFEVFRRGDVALLPGAEPPLVGITAWRGELIPVLELHQPLGLPAPAEGDRTRVVVLGDEHPAFGVLVDSVQGLRELSPSEIRPLPEGSTRGGGVLLGITPDAVLLLAAAGLVRTFS